ncbi:protoporphyrinogen oxidase HemJ [uncultured Methylovirgula sp.]|uniref:protoporphyrinogen oxidase HemJ n=1 Tax=uncultured Methylovirgula sp. TaxID=1285960 RepID=UPI0026110235|nr:protoporphyrinogen oxidase HemJ [uncultured Methylovirgula sp.]
MDQFYLWIKALHIIAVIAFMAGMLYLPRLFVYHAGAEKGSPQSETFKVMERRLEIAIMRPALIVVYATGLTLAIKGQFFRAAWLNWKFVLVLAMTAIYFYLIAMRRRFAADRNRHAAKFYRILNEIPTLLLIGIVILAVVKPGGVM